MKLNNGKLANTDIKNLIEELGGLAIIDRRESKNRFSVLIEHFKY